MIVVLDTNIWKSSLYLKAGAAAAMRFYLHQKRAKVGLPEVIRLEVEHHLRADLREVRDRIRSEHKRLLGMMGTLKEVLLPDDKGIDAVVAGFISGLKFELVETELTLEAARASFLRTIDKISPSENSQQFKDGVIWNDCLTLAQTDDVTLVTSDRAFYEGGDVNKGLSRALVAEAVGLPFRLRVVGSLGSLMADIKAPVAVADEVLAAAVRDHLSSDISRMLDRLGFAQSGPASVSRVFYATEEARILFVEFNLKFPLKDLTGSGRTKAELSVDGDGQYESATQQFGGLSPNHLAVSYKTADGEEERKRGAYIHGITMGIGVRTVHHEVRERLDDMDGFAITAVSGSES